MSVVATAPYRVGQASSAAGSFDRQAYDAEHRAASLRREAAEEPATVAAITRAVAALYERHAEHLARMAAEFRAVAGAATP